MNRSVRSLHAGALLAAFVCLLAGAPPAATQAPAARPDDTEARSRWATDPIPPTLGAPHFVWLDAFEGLPADTLGGVEVLAGFRGAFASLLLATQVVKSEHPHTEISLPLSNRFRLIEGSSGYGTWRLQVAIRPEGRFSGAAVTDADSTGTLDLVVFQIFAAALPPDADPETARPIPSRARVSFREPRTADEALALYDEIGRTVGLFALEHLHQRSGDLDANAEIQFGERVFRGELP
jgi:hypothetical protein